MAGNGVRSARLWARLLGLAKVVVEDVEFDEVEQVLVVSARPRKATKRRCGRCGKRCPGYDQGEGRRRWRTLDFGQVRAFLEADSPRVRCAEHGVIAAQVGPSVRKLSPAANGDDLQRDRRPGGRSGSFWGVPRTWVPACVHRDGGSSPPSGREGAGWSWRVWWTRTS